METIDYKIGYFNCCYESTLYYITNTAWLLVSFPHTGTHSADNSEMKASQCREDYFVIFSIFKDTQTQFRHCFSLWLMVCNEGLLFLSLQLISRALDKRQLRRPTVPTPFHFFLLLTFFLGRATA